MKPVSPVEIKDPVEASRVSVKIDLISREGVPVSQAQDLSVSLCSGQFPESGQWLLLQLLPHDLVSVSTNI